MIGLSVQMFHPVCEAFSSSAWSISLKETLRSTQTKTLFLATQALLRELRSKASFLVSKSGFTSSLSTDLYDLQHFLLFLWL